ncbi:MAG: OmpH family outer membrane protein [Planctomycetes bacterium]|nr:OmpH family outer membrane protein [Planctomycetota bacterium]
MKSNRVVVLAIAVIVVAGVFLNRLTAQSPTAPAAMRAAVCNVSELFQQYQQAKDLSADLTTQQQAVAEGADQRTGVIETMRKDLEELKEGSDAYETKSDELAKLILERDLWANTEKAKLMRRYRNLTEQTYTTIIEGIKQVAEQSGYQLVLSRDEIDIASKTEQELFAKMAQRKVLYSDPAIDITQAVVSYLNEQYQQKKL